MLSPLAKDVIHSLLKIHSLSLLPYRNKISMGSLGLTILADKKNVNLSRFQDTDPSLWKGSNALSDFKLVSDSFDHLYSNHQGRLRFVM